MRLLNQLEEHNLSTYIFEQISFGRILEYFDFMLEDGSSMRVQIFTSELDAINNFNVHCIQVIILIGDLLSSPKKHWIRKYNENISFKKNGVSKKYRLLKNINPFSSEVTYKYLTIMNKEKYGNIYHREIEYPSTIQDNYDVVYDQSLQFSNSYHDIYKPVIYFDFNTKVLMIPEPQTCRVTIRNYYSRPVVNEKPKPTTYTFKKAPEPKYK